MLQAFVITLREGLEAFLIVAISLSYLRQSGRAQLTAAVHWGIAVALGISALGGYVLYHAANQEWLDGPLAIVAAVSVTWMVVHMWRAGRRMKGDIEGHLRLSSGRAGGAAFVGVFLFTLLMISREGMETALLLMQLRETVHLAMGALGGILGAAGVAWLWSRVGHRVNLSLFFQVTAIFLVVFVAQLMIRGAHEMADYLLVILPLGWLVAKSCFSRRPIFKTPALTPHVPAAPSSMAEAPVGSPSSGR